jgi:hypothetical protein
VVRDVTRLIVLVVETVEWSVRVSGMLAQMLHPADQGQAGAGEWIRCIAMEDYVARDSVFLCVETGPRGGDVVQEMKGGIAYPWYSRPLWVNRTEESVKGCWCRVVNRYSLGRNSQKYPSHMRSAVAKS